MHAAVFTRRTVLFILMSASPLVYVRAADSLGHRTILLVPSQLNSNSICIDAVSPNPATEDPTVTFHIIAAGRVSLAIADVLGRERIVMDKIMSIGVKQTAISLRDVRPGVYRCILRAAGQVDVKPLVVMR